MSNSGEGLRTKPLEIKEKYELQIKDYTKPCWSCVSEKLNAMLGLES